MNRRLASYGPFVAPLCHVAPVQTASGTFPGGHHGFASRDSDEVLERHAAGVKSHGCPQNGLLTLHTIRGEQVAAGKTAQKPKGSSGYV